jgi:hypothetical protein
MEDFLNQEDCTCRCHEVKRIPHEVACCDGLPIDFYDEIDKEMELFGSAESSRPKGRSAAYEEPDEWMSFIHDKKTGKPLRGPGSDSAV